MSAAEVIEFPEPLDPRGLVRGFVDSTPNADPRTVTERLLAECDEPMLRVLLESSLPRFVREIMRDQQHAAGVRPLPGAAKGARTSSKKWDKAAEIFARPRAVGWGQSWKPFGEWTVLDLHVTAAQRRTLANSNAREATRYNALAKLMKERGVERVDGLPPMTVRDVLHA